MSHVIHVQKRSQKSGNWGICKSDCTRGAGGQRRHLAQVVKVQAYLLVGAGPD